MVHAAVPFWEALSHLCGICLRSAFQEIPIIEDEVALARIPTSSKIGEKGVPASFSNFGSQTKHKVPPRASDWLHQSCGLVGMTGVERLGWSG